MPYLGTFFAIYFNMKKVWFFFIFILLAQTILAQITGRVIDASNQQPILGASIFFSNTSRGTVTQQDGSFQLSLPGNGRFELVVSFIGYETYTTTILSNQIPSKLEIKLKPKATELDEVIVEPYEKNGWAKWGKTFIELFLGTTEESKLCKLLNPEVLKFRFSKKTQTLKVSANSPLIIENRALGYNIKYQMEVFSYDFSKRYLLFVGYPFFEEMKAKRNRQIENWRSNRAYVYEGSVTHFMRALYRNQLIEEGFEIRSLVKIVNQNKAQRKAAIKESMLKSNQVVVQSAPTAPSQSVYSGSPFSEPDSFSVASSSLLPADSIAFAVDSTVCGLYFKNYVQVIYVKQPAPKLYQQQQGSDAANSSQISDVRIIGDRPILLLSNGSYFEPTELVYQGYWAWSEKISRMLPFDYKRKK